MSSEAEDVEFDEAELPTRQSGVALRAYARETEAILARGGHPDDAQGLVETVPPKLPSPEENAARLAAVVRLTVSSEELAWFPLGAETTAIARAVDGRSPVSVVLERANLSPSDGLPHLDTLVELGVVAFK